MNLGGRSLRIARGSSLTIRLNSLSERTLVYRNPNTGVVAGAERYVQSGPRYDFARVDLNATENLRFQVATLKPIVERASRRI